MNWIIKQSINLNLTCWFATLNVNWLVRSSPLQKLLNVILMVWQTILWPNTNFQKKLEVLVHATSKVNKCYSLFFFFNVIVITNFLWHLEYFESNCSHIISQQCAWWKVDEKNDSLGHLPVMIFKHLYGIEFCIKHAYMNPLINLLNLVCLHSNWLWWWYH